MLLLWRCSPTFQFYCFILVLLSVHENQAFYDDNLEGDHFVEHQCYPFGFQNEKKADVNKNGLNSSFTVIVRKNIEQETKIKGVIKWKRVPETQSDSWVTGYQMIFEVIGPDRCHQGFSPIHRTFSKHTCGFDVFEGFHSDYPHVLNFRCDYILKLNTIPCNNTKCKNETKFISIGDCSEYASGCVCKEIPTVQNLTAINENPSFSLNQSTVRLQWNYPLDINNSSKANKFLVLLFEKEAAISTEVQAKDGLGVYHILLNINGSSTSIEDISAKVIALDQDNCKSKSKDLEELLLQDDNKNNSSITNNSAVSNTSLELITGNDRISSLVTAFLLIAGLVLIMVIAGFALLYQRFNARKTQQELPHPRNLAQFRLMFNSKPGFNYFSAGKEGINTLYIEQEIQEALDKGVVDHYEISPNRIAIGHEIGTGAFGQVFIATMEKFARFPDKTVVAVKCLRDCSTEFEKQDFLREIDVMKRAGHHPNVIHMIACCTIQQPVCMIMEFVEYGDLLNYLRKTQSAYKTIIASKFTAPLAHSSDTSKLSQTNSRHNDDSFLLHSSDTLKEFDQSDSGSSPQTDLSEWSEMTFETNTFSSSSKTDYQLNPKQLLSFAWQIANGMNHLVKQGIVHRDLAARNVLIGLDKVLKISDFGLSRSGVYVTRRGGKVPLRWLSIEAITDSIYSTQSDVWAYGVVLWEICTLGETPYSSVGDREILKYLLSNKRLEKPPQCTEKLYNVMTTCWDIDPLARPDFQQLLNIINDMEKEPHKYVNFSYENVNIG